MGRVHAAIAGLIGAAKERGELNADADPALLGAAWFSFFYFALIGWVQGAPHPPERLVRKLFGQHLRGLQTTKRKRSSR